LPHLETLKQLESLVLTNTQITTAAAQKLSKSLPKCKILYGPHENPITINPTASTSSLRIDALKL